MVRVKELLYNGTGAAITITASNVTLDLLNHDLIIGESATGILAQNVRELVIKNDSISTPSLSTQATSHAIHLTGCEKVTIENIFTANTLIGIQLDSNCFDIQVRNSHFKDHTGGITGAVMPFLMFLRLDLPLIIVALRGAKAILTRPPLRSF